jgi:hypothetical protein
MAKEFPLYFVILTCAIVSLIFPDRWNYLTSLALVTLLFLGCLSVGRHLLAKTADAPDSWFFPAGLGVVLACCCILFSFSAKFIVIILIWLLIAGFSFFELKYLTVRFNRQYLFFAPLILLAFWSSFTPTTFYDALAYHLGLPYEYFAYGRMSIFPHQLFSTFPPFEQAMNLLFVGLGCLSGIKLISLVFYLSLIHVFFDITRKIVPSNFNSQFVCWVLLLFPAPWILIHLISADLLVSLFFCCGIAALVNQSGLSAKFQTLVVSAFISFAILTKLNCLLYTAFLPILTLTLNPEKRFSTKLRILFSQGLLILLFISPFLVRNYFATGDPLYPALKSEFPNSAWTEEQQLALRQDSFSSRENILLDALKTPIVLALRKGSFGAAAEPGFVFLVGILVYLVSRKNYIVNRILVYTLVCYVAWLLVFFSFRQFLPGFLLLALPSAIGFHALVKRSRIVSLVLLLLICIQFVTCLIPVFGKFFPLIRVRESQSDYLRANLDYFKGAEKMNALNSGGKILFIGETRSSYVNRKTIVSSRYNYNPLFKWVTESRDVNELVKRFQKDEVQYVFINWREYRHILIKSGILYLDILPSRFRNEIPPNLMAHSGSRIHYLNKRDASLLQQFLSSYVIPIWQSDDTFYLYQMQFKDIERSYE